MASPLSRLNGIFPGLKLAPTPPVRTAAEAKARLAESTRRGRPATEERVPIHYGGGVVGKIWFHPYADSATRDGPDIRAAMRLMPRNPYVKAAWWTQILSVMCQDWQFHAAEKGNAESEAQCKALETCVREYTAGGPPEIARAVCTPFGPEGYTLAEKVWDYADRGRLAGKFVLKAVKAKESDDAEPVGDKFGNVTHVRSRRAALTDFPVGEFIYSRYLPVFDEPLGMAAFRGAYGEWWMLDTVEKLRAIHVEKRMGGMLLGEYEDDADRGPLEAALRAAKTATWMAVPAGVKVQAVALSTASEPDFKSFVESKQSGVVLGISGATLQILQGTVPDARADTKTQKQMSDLFPWLLSYLLLEAFNRQVVPDFIDFNFPYAAGGYPRATLGAVANKELLELLDVIARAQAAGFDDLDKAYYAASLSLQRADPKKPEDKLAPAAPQGPPGMPPGGGLPFSGFAEWKPYTNPQTKQQGWVSDGGQVRYGDNPGGGGADRLGDPGQAAAPGDRPAPPADPGKAWEDLGNHLTDAHPGIGASFDADYDHSKYADHKGWENSLSDRRWRGQETNQTDEQVDQFRRDWKATDAALDDYGRKAVAFAGGGEALASDHAERMGAVRAAAEGYKDALAEASELWVAREAKRDAVRQLQEAPLDMTRDAVAGYLKASGRDYPPDILDRPPERPAATAPASEKREYNEALREYKDAREVAVSGAKAKRAGELAAARAELAPAEAAYRPAAKAFDAAAKELSGAVAGYQGWVESLVESAWEKGPPAARHAEGGRAAPRTTFPAARFSESESSEVAVAGKDGRRAATLLANAKREGVSTLARLAERAVGRLLASGSPLSAAVLFDEAELRELSESLASTVATADLLGRARIRRRAEMAAAGAEAFAEADPDDPFTVFDDATPGGIPFLAPEAALDYFRGLVPSLAGDPGRYGPLLQRHAFTLAHATDQTLLERVKAAILAKLQGQTAAPGNVAVEDLLEAAGVTPRNPQYAEMVYRSNMMDGYSSGATAELASPDMREAFPVWQYDGIDDDRAGDDHRPKFGRYYPSTAIFADVRGPRIFNCRCVLPGQFVAGRVLAASKAWYTGQAVQIVTRKGTRLAVTPNHPVATRAGWVAAGRLREGDHLFHNQVVADRLVVGDQIQDRPALIEDVFSSLPQENAVRVTKRWTALDFHGDGPALECEVEVVTATRGLLLELLAVLDQSRSQFPFRGGDGQQLRLPGGSPAFAAGTDTVTAAVPAQGYPLGSQAEADRRPTHLEGSGERKDGLAGLVPGDDFRGRQDGPQSPFAANVDREAGLQEMPLKGFRLHTRPPSQLVHVGARGMIGREPVETRDRLCEGEVYGLSPAPHRHQFAEPLAKPLGVGESQTRTDGLDRLPALVAADDFAPIQRVVSGRAGQGGRPAVTADLQAQGLEPGGQLAAADAARSTDGPEGFPVGVPDDEVQQVAVFHYDGPVYDLMTADGHYAVGADSCSMSVVHNCGFTPVYKTAWAELEAKGAKVETSW